MQDITPTKKRPNRSCSRSLKISQDDCLSLMRTEGLEPSWLPTRPSSVRVYRFRHVRSRSKHNIEETDLATELLIS